MPRKRKKKANKQKSPNRKMKCPSNVINLNNANKNTTMIKRKLALPFSAPTVQRYNTWISAYRYTNLLMFYWLNLVSIIGFSGFIFLIFNADIIGLSYFFLISFSLIPMLYLGNPYQGIVGCMNLPHALACGFITLYQMYRLFFSDITIGNESKTRFLDIIEYYERITFEKHKYLYIWSLACCAVLIVSFAIDWHKIFHWYVLRNRSVLRTPIILRQLKKIKLLKEDIGLIHVIMVNGIAIDKNADEYGYQYRYQYQTLK